MLPSVGNARCYYFNAQKSFGGKLFDGQDKQNWKVLTCLAYKQYIRGKQLFVYKVWAHFFRQFNFFVIAESSFIFFFLLSLFARI